MRVLIRLFRWLPRWVASGVCLAAILWLTLAPRPAGDIDVPLFPGADKLVHAVMFGGLAVVATFDVWHHSHARPFSRYVPWVMAAAATLVGVAIEYLQRAMDMGRGFDPMDMLADLAGALTAALILTAFRQRLSSQSPRPGAGVS